MNARLRVEDIGVAVAATAVALFLASGGAGVAAQETPTAGGPAPDTTPAHEAWKRHSFFPIPVLFYTPETRWAGGAAGLHSYRPRPAGRPTVSSGGLVYTQNRQVSAEIQTEAYLADGRYMVSAQLGYSKFPDKFYGIGNATRADDEETYTSRGARAELEARRRVAPGLYLGAACEIRDTEIIEREEDGLLAGGSVRGSEGSLVSGGGLVLAWDTRDNVVNATSGSYHTASVFRTGGLLGGDFSFTRYTLDLRRFVPVRQGHVLGLHGYGRAVTRDVPFDLMPRLGGQNIMRGTFQGRYRDRWLLATQAEYRFHLWWRLGAVAFAGAGQVAERLDAVSLADLHPSVGGGLRFMLDPRDRMNLRFDLGYGRDGASGVYITIGEAF
jgi:outer membrane protein assembly factor BamA